MCDVFSPPAVEVSFNVGDLGPDPLDLWGVQKDHVDTGRLDRHGVAEPLGLRLASGRRRSRPPAEPSIRVSVVAAASDAQLTGDIRSVLGVAQSRRDG